MEEFEIDWIPEDTGAPYEADDIHPDIPSHSIDKLCKAKYGHTNWARMGQMANYLHKNMEDIILGKQPDKKQRMLSTDPYAMKE